MAHSIGRFLTSAKGALATVGTIVAIAVGVHALLPSPSPPPATLKADFSRVTAYPDVDLEEYETRFGSNAVAQTPSSTSQSPAASVLPYRLLRADAPASATASATSSTATATETTSSVESDTSALATSTHTSVSSTSTSSTSTSSHTTSSGKPPPATSSTSTSSSSPVTTSTSKTTTTLGSTSTFATPPPAQVPFSKGNGVPSRIGTGVPEMQVKAVSAALAGTEVEAEAATPTFTGSNPPGSTPTRVKLVVPAACNSSACAMTPLIDHALTYHANPVEAARSVAVAFAHSRGRVIDHRFYPTGVAVNYAVDLAGFEHHEAFLVWSLWSKATGAPLPRSWLQNVIASEVEPQREEESFAGQFWIPTPHSPGEYVVHLTLYDERDIDRGQAETEPPFH